MFIAPLTVPIALIRTRHLFCINTYLSPYLPCSANTQFATLLLCLEVLVTLQRLAGFMPFRAITILMRRHLLLFGVVCDTAYRSSQYLSSLLDRRLIEPNPSIELDKLYTSFTPSSRISQNLPPPILPPGSSETESTIRNVATDKKSEPETASGTGESLLTRKAVPPILAMFRLPESAAVNMYRAVDQAGRLMKSS